MITIRPVHPLFGCEITGVDLRAASAQAVAEIKAALDAYGLVVLRDQPLSDDELRAAGALFGEVSISQAKEYGIGAGIFRITNIGPSGELMPNSERVLEINLANMLWHTDKSYMRPRAEYTFLEAQVAPPEGADTLYCDTRVAYEALSAADKAAADKAFAFHSLIHSRSLTGFTGWTQEEIERLKPVRRPLVETQAATGRKALCLASHMSHIEGYDPEDSIHFIRRLMDIATRPEHVYAHKWRVGDLLIWDNRFTLHRATPFDSARHARDMRSLRTVDHADA